MKKRACPSLILFGVLLAVGAGSAVAQEQDAENCKDHPLLSRMKNFYIWGCEANFDSVDFYVAEDETKAVEGQKTKIDYSLPEGTQAPSYLQLRRNYGNAIKNLGGTILPAAGRKYGNANSALSFVGGFPLFNSNGVRIWLLQTGDRSVYRDLERSFVNR